MEERSEASARKNEEKASYAGAVIGIGIGIMLLSITNPNEIAAEIQRAAGWIVIALGVCTHSIVTAISRKQGS